MGRMQHFRARLGKGFQPPLSPQPGAPFRAHFPPFLLGTELRWYDVWLQRQGRTDKKEYSFVLNQAVSYPKLFRAQRAGPILPEKESLCVH